MNYQRSNVAVLEGLQRFGSLQFHNKHRKVSAFIIDETVIQIGNRQYWLWICIEPIHNPVLGIYISEERNILIAEKFIRSLVEKYDKHTEFTQMEVLIFPFESI